MTDRMRAVREAFADQVGQRVRVMGATLTWPSTLANDEDCSLALSLSIDNGHPRLHEIGIEGGSDLVAVATEWGKHWAEALKQVSPRVSDRASTPQHSAPANSA